MQMGIAKVQDQAEFPSPPTSDLCLLTETRRQLCLRLGMN